MYGLLGKTLKHSFSKKIHQQLGLTYQLIETDDLDTFFDTVDFKGLNITIPYKSAVISYCDVLDPLVKATKSCNTIVKRDGLLYAYNTDYAGFIASLNYYKMSLNSQKVGIIGNGATSRTIQTAAKSLGAESIEIYARNPKEGEYPLSTLQEPSKITILINTTPVGMYPDNQGRLPILLENLPNLQGVIDLVYNPLQTQLLLDAKKRNIPTMNGLYMLVAQAVESNQLFQEKHLGTKQTQTIYRTLKKAQTNIVFIGMPKSGKSLYSKIYAEKHNRELYDIDLLFEERFHQSIKDYFHQYGELEFRKEEAKIIAEISHYSGIVISTGGGAILQEKNIDYLKQNGLVIFIDASLDLIKRTGVSNHRPLLNKENALDTLYEDRYLIYRNSADIVFKKESLHTTTNINELEVLIYEYFGA
jgi:shikimate dehydrogenase